MDNVKARLHLEDEASKEQEVEARVEEMLDHLLEDVEERQDMDVLFVGILLQKGDSAGSCRLGSTCSACAGSKGAARTQAPAPAPVLIGLLLLILG